MDIPTERDIRDYQRLEAVYDTTAKGTQEIAAEDVRESFDDHGDRYRWLHEKANVGLLRIDRSLMPRLNLTAEGADSSRRRAIDVATGQRGASPASAACSLGPTSTHATCRRAVRSGG